MHWKKNHNHIDKKLCWIENNFVDIEPTRLLYQFDNYIVAAWNNVDSINEPCWFDNVLVDIEPTILFYQFENTIVEYTSSKIVKSIIIYC